MFKLLALNNVDLYMKPGSPLDLRGLLAAMSLKMPGEWVYRPVGIEVELTSGCNIRCAGCAQRLVLEPLKAQLKAAPVLTFLEQAKAEGLWFYSMTGGEPFTVKNTMLSIMRQAPLDLMKINTNGSAFATLDTTRQVFETLMAHGFLDRNQFFKPGLVVSQGQQTDAGVPLMNSINVLQVALEQADPKAVPLEFLLFHPDLVRSEALGEQFRSMIVEHRINWQDLLLELSIIRDTINCSTDIRLHQEKEPVSLIQRLSEFKGKSLHCRSTEEQIRHGQIGPRMLLRPDGNVFACTGFVYAFPIGNIYHQSLRTMLETANQDPLITAVYRNGPEGLIRIAQKTGLADAMVPANYGACNLCQFVRDQSGGQ